MKTAEGGGLLQRGLARGRTAAHSRATWLAVSALPVLLFACRGKPGECIDHRDCAAASGAQAGTGGEPANASGSGGSAGKASAGGAGGSSGATAPSPSAGKGGSSDDVETAGAAGAPESNAGAGGEPEPEIDPCSTFACENGSCGLQHGLPVCDCSAAFTGSHCELPRFEALGIPDGFEHSYPTAITSDGNTVYGYARDDDSTAQASFRWTHAEGQVVLAPAHYSITGVSADGTIAAGDGPNGENASKALRWSSSEGFTELGQPPGGDENSSTTATAISADGSTICGSAMTVDRNFAFRWTAAARIVELPFPKGASPDTSMQVHAVSADGETIVGELSDPGASAGAAPFVWTLTTGTQRLGAGKIGSAQALSADGSQIFGWLEDSGRRTAFRFTAASGFTVLDSTAMCSNSLVTSVSADGTVAAGTCTVGTARKAFVWDEARGIRSVDSALTALGAAAPIGRSLWYVDALSGDGKTAIGRSVDESGHNEAWIARFD